jgi:hypothetical protein
MFKDVHRLAYYYLCKNIDNYMIYGLIIVKTEKTIVNVKLWIIKHHF